jgi:2-methylcitrate dehydratase PrpD
MDATYSLIDYLKNVRYENLPHEVVEATKKDILDVLGCMIAGSKAPGIKELVELIKEACGKEESTLMGWGWKVPAVDAALANGTMARAWDFDGVHEEGGGHPSATVIPALLSLAQRQGEITGRDLILACAVGIDLFARLRCSFLTPGRPYVWASETAAPIALGMVCGLFLGFDAEKMINAAGIGYAQVAGNLQPYLDGALTIRLQQGLAARAGVFAALLAEKGFTGAKYPLEGPHGFYHTYCQGNYDRNILLKDLGKVFEGSKVSVKPYPCCKHVHGAIFGTIELVNQHHIQPEDIEEIRVYLHSRAEITDSEEKRTPRTIVDAQFSLYHAVVTALVKNDFSLDDLSEDAYEDPIRLELAKMVKAIRDPELDKVRGLVGPTIVEIGLKNGIVHKKEVNLEKNNFVKGSPQNPMSFDEVSTKFKKLTDYSITALQEKNIHKTVETIRNLESVANVSDILETLT